MSLCVPESNPGSKTIFFLKVTACAFLVSVYLRCLCNPIVDLDLWHQMALIRESIALGHIPLNDRFAYTPTVFPSVHHEWGAGAIAYFLAMQFGAPGILTAKYLLALFIVVFPLLCLKRRGVSTEVFAFLALVVIALIGGGFSTIRAQLYSLTLVGCLLWFFELDRDETRRWLIAWIPLYLIWINLHAGFLVGIGILAAYWVERLLLGKPHAHLVLTGVVMVGLIAVNPYGLSYYPYILHAMLMPRPNITEWYPIWAGLDMLGIASFFVSLMLLTYSVRKIGFRNAHGLIVVLLVGLASILCNRLVLFYALVWTVYVPGYIQETPLSNMMSGLWKRSSRFLILLLCIATVAISIRIVSFRPWKLLVPSDQIKKYGDHPIYPVGPVEYLTEIAFKGNLMVSFNSGSYVLWKLYPNVRVSIDSRYEVAYPEWLVDENTRFYMAKNGWQHTLTAYPTDLVLVDKKMPLAKVMPKATGWKKVYTDQTFEVYSRPGLTLPVVDRTGRVFEGTFP